MSSLSKGDHASIGTFGDREQSLSPIAPATERSTNYANAALDQSERRRERSFMLSHASFSQRIDASFAPSNISSGSFYPTEDSREERLRLLVYDAQHYDLKQTTVFLAEKLVALTDGFIEDVYNLASAYYRSQQYHRALVLLNTKSTIHRSVECRYLAGLCARALGSSEDDGLDYVGHKNPFIDNQTGPVQSLTPLPSRGPCERLIKLESVMCYLRGGFYLNKGIVDEARDCFKEALRVDVKCYDALADLVKYNLLTEEEEYEFITTLPYDEFCGKDSEFFRALYILEMTRSSHRIERQEAQRSAEEDFRLHKSIDVIYSAAQTCFATHKIQECFELCQKIRQEDALYPKVLPIYLACLYELDMKPELLETAQELVDHMNDQAVTWHAVGLYNLYIKNYQEARKYFQQATSLDQYFEPAWLGYGHAFAGENDHNQAIRAYETYCRLVPGSHLPYLYIGMQYKQQGSKENTIDNLNKSLERYRNDPFLLNEFADFAYMDQSYDDALVYLRRALRIAYNHLSARCPLWSTLWNNLGHVYRKKEEYQRAIRCFKEALRYDPRSGDIHASIAIIHQLHGEDARAIEGYTKASIESEGAIGCCGE
ncbi:hypothetical protein BCR43DRAFT_88272 [Syncephalastrum racemosum]|uniref:Uncharacterized protein n=1 Tax=Syncephalastrum racemosum TaxID=13706 RepID=A0A1X2H4J4_SYNRA|nr:hypothetical protein BCR43DRAFT_88272 [Syncephalastrum racemosum]